MSGLAGVDLNIFAESRLGVHNCRETFVQPQFTTQKSKHVIGFSAVLEVLLEKGQGSPLHVHRRESEIIDVAEGVCVVGDSEQDQTVATGDLVVFEKDTPHFFRNDGDTKTKLIITAIPGGLDRYFEEVSAAVQGEKPEEIENINRKYEIEFSES